MQHVLEVFNMNVTESQASVGGIVFVSLFLNPCKLTNSILLPSMASKAALNRRLLCRPAFRLISHVVSYCNFS